MKTPTPEYVVPPVEVVPAASVLETVQESIVDEFAHLLNPVVQFAKRLPAFSGNILELHFDKPANCFDFACRINSEFDSHQLSHAGRLNHIPSFSMIRYDQLLTESETAFRYGINNLWFEYDSPFESDPALFFDLNRDQPFCSKEIFSILRHLGGSFDFKYSCPLFEFLQQIEKLRLYIVYYGIMFSRKAAGLRLTLNGVKADRLIYILKTLGWAGNYLVLEDICRNYLNVGQELVLSVDFDERLGSRIGIEVFDRNYDGLIAILQKNKLLNTKHSELLANWKGTLPMAPDLSDQLARMFQRNTPCIYKRTNHFKFIVDDDLVTAKAYLYYCF